MKQHIWEVLIVLSLVLLTSTTAKANSPEPYHLQDDSDALLGDECETIVQEFAADEDWFEELINPHLSSQEELLQRYDLYSKVYVCLNDIDETASQDVVVLKNLIKYYLIFAGGFDTPESETRLTLASFDTLTDPAIVSIRDEAGVPAPDGFVFVRYYSSREAMPDLVRRAFTDKDSRGVTILARYIAVLVEDTETWYDEALARETLPETISHELIHAYVNATLGRDGYDFPKWYHEGLAIYFSGSGENHSFVTPEFVVSSTSPEEYQQYDTNFKYLEAKLGREKLLNLINQSLLQADPDVLFYSLDITNDQVLAARSSTWVQQKVFFRAGIVIAALSVILFVALRRREPELKCPRCGKTGEKKEFLGKRITHHTNHPAGTN